MTKEKQKWLESIEARFSEPYQEWRYTIGPILNNTGWDFVIPKERAEEMTLEAMQREYGANKESYEQSIKLRERITENGFEENQVTMVKPDYFPHYMAALAQFAQAAFWAINTHERCYIVLEHNAKALSDKITYFVNSSGAPGASSLQTQPEGSEARNDS